MSEAERDRIVGEGGDDSVPSPAPGLEFELIWSVTVNAIVTWRALQAHTGEVRVVMVFLDGEVRQEGSLNASRLEGVPERELKVD